MLFVPKSSVRASNEMTRVKVEGEGEEREGEEEDERGAVSRRRVPSRSAVTRERCALL